jgi:prolyl oligopeptidase
MLYRHDGRLRRLPFPTMIILEGVLDGRTIVRLRVPWEYSGRSYPTGSLVALKLEDMTAELIFAPGDHQAINDVAIGKTNLYIELLENVAGKIKRASRGPDGWTVTDIALPGNGVIEIVSANRSGQDLLVSYESLVDPDSLYYISADTKPRKIRSLPAFFDASDVVVEQRFATSKDGTFVPYYLMARKDVLEEGNAPTIQYGYGGFLVAIGPYYYNEPERPQDGALAGRMWVSRGGVLVVSNIRGGGEFGPAWHEAALKHNRHKAFEDFFAISEALIAEGVTTPAKLGAIGRSNGGLLMGVAFTQRADLYAAIDCGAPLADMIRYDKLLAGASWVGEYGDPDIREDRDYILTYSPYQNLKKDADYPEVLFYTSTKDDRVHPGHARKMAAKMDAFGHPFLYYENIEGGHGGTANQDQLAFRTALEYMYFIRKLMDGNGPDRVGFQTYRPGGFSQNPLAR